MVPLHLLLRNFLCYRELPGGEALKLDLSGLHVVCLSGENGAGKSSLLDAITWALWGEARAADDELITQGEAQTLVDLIFELNGRKHRVIRTRTRGKTTSKGTQSAGKSTLDLQIMSDDGVWRVHSQHTLRETQDEVTRLLRMSYRTFINASFLLQGRADEFTRRTPAERKQVLAEILDLSAYARLETAARERANGLKSDLQAIKGKIEVISRTADMLEYWREQTAAAEQRRHDLQERHSAAAAALEAAALRIRSLEEIAAQRREAAVRLQGVRELIDDRTAELERLQQRMRNDAALIARAELISSGYEQLVAARARLAVLEQQRDQYYRLDQQRNRLREQWSDAAQVFRADAERARLQRDNLREQAAEDRRLADEIQQLADRLAGLHELDAQLAAAQQQRRNAEDALQQRRTQQQRLQAVHEQARQRQHLLQRRLNDLQQRLQRLDQQLQTRDSLEARLSAALHAADGLVAAEARLQQERSAEQQLRDTISRLQADLRTVEQEEARLTTAETLLQSGSGPCPVCRRELDQHTGELALQHYAAERAALAERRSAERAALARSREQLDAQQQAVAAAEQELLGLRGTAQLQTQLREQLNSLAAVATEAQATRHELSGLQAELTGNGTESAAERAELEAALQLSSEAALQRDVQAATAAVTRGEQALRERVRLETEQLGLQRQRSSLAVALAALPAAEQEAAELWRRWEAKDFNHALRDAGRAVSAAITELNFQIADWEAVRAEVAQLADWDEQQRTLELARQRFSGDGQLFEQEQQLLSNDRQKRAELETLIAALELQLAALPELRRQLTALKQEFDQRAQALRGAELELQEQRTYLRAAEAAAEQLRELQQQERATAVRKDLFSELVLAFGKSGIQAMLIETAIPQIEDEANALLGRLSDGRMHLTLDTQRDTKKGDQIETLDIRIADELGTRSYDAFSGGEALRVNFALRIALSRLLAQRAGASLETLVIDEGFGVLDATGRDRMIEAITSVQDTFKRIIVITHIDELKERFPATIDVRKTANGSRWELR